MYLFCFLFFSSILLLTINRLAFQIKSQSNLYHPLLHQELYGREAIRSATRISNPGCYATLVQLLTAPLLPRLSFSSTSELLAQPTIFGVSGYSGAGTISSTSPDGEPVTLPKVDPTSLNGAHKAYTLTDHIHEREAGVHLSNLLQQPKPSSEPGVVNRKREVKVAFTPHIGPWFSSILGTLSFPLTPSPDLRPKLSARDILEIYKEYYKDEKLIRVKEDGKVVELRDVENKQGAVIGGIQVQSEGRRVVVTVGHQ